MVTVWMATVLLGVTPPDGGAASVAVAESPPAAEATTAEERVVELREGAELRDAVRAALAKWARATDEQADEAARQFLVLYHELERDGELAPTQRQKLQQKVRGRLMHLVGRLKTRRAVDRRLARERGEQPDTVDRGDRPETLGQFGGGQMGGFGGGMGAMGGGGRGMGRGGNSMVGDASDELIELIQRTIAPASWDVNGGPGAIYYFRPNHAMVISNTDEVHEEIGNVLDQLRRAGN